MTDVELLHQLAGEDRERDDFVWGWLRDNFERRRGTPLYDLVFRLAEWRRLCDAEDVLEMIGARRDRWEPRPGGLHPRSGSLASGRWAGRDHARRVGAGRPV